jgi:hypothetical protein
LRRTLAPIAVLPIALLALAGCSSSNLDTGKAEKEIQRGIQQQTGVKVKSVTCPDGVEAKKGDTFNCVVRAVNGQKAIVRVRQTDDEGNVRWRLKGG